MKTLLILLTLTSAALAQERTGLLHDRDGRDKPVAGISLTPDEQAILLRKLNVEDDPSGYRKAARERVAAGKVAPIDVVLLNYPMMIDPDPAVQDLLAKLRKALTP